MTSAPSVELWSAPVTAGPLDALVEVPGSKSLTNRYLVLAALADGPGLLRGALRSRDTRLMAAALGALGTVVDEDGSDWSVTPGVLTGGTTIHCGLAGTVMRFLPAVAALADGAVRFDGDTSALARPMGPVLGALRTLGVRVEEHGEPGHLPFTVHGRGGLAGGQVDIDASESSQFVSGSAPRGRPVRARADAAAHRPDAAEPAAHRDDRRPAARGRRRGRRLPTRHLAGLPRSDRGPRRPRRARPVERGAVPVRGPGRRRVGERPRMAVADDPARWPAAGDPRAHGRAHRPGRRRAHRHRDRCDPRRRPRPARRGRDRPDDRGAGGAGRLPHAPARHRPPARARDGPARGARGRDHARRRAGGADVGRPGHHAPAPDRCRLAHVRGPPDGDRGRAGRPARPRHRGRGRRDDREDAAGLRRPLVGHAAGDAGARA